MSEKQAATEKQEAALQAKWHEDVNGLIQWLWRQGRLFQAEHGLNDDQVAFAIALLQINCRQSFPKGADSFDEQHKKAWAYFEDQTGA